MSALRRLVGTWDLTMRHVAVEEPIIGRETYRTILDGAFVELTRTYEHPDFPDAVAIMSETVAHHFDVRGVVRVFEQRFDATSWISQRSRGSEAFAQRQTAHFTTPDVIDGVGEMSHDDGMNWVRDYTINLIRTDR